MRTYFAFNQNKAIYLAEQQSLLQPSDYFDITPNLKTTTLINTIVLTPQNNRIDLRNTRPVFILKTDLVNLFPDLEANSEFNTTDVNILQNYLGTADGV